MLWFQARAGDFSRAGSERRPAGLLIVNRTSRCWFLAILLLSLVLGVSSLAPYASAQSKGRKGKPRAKGGASSSPGEQSLTNIPLPIGHEAKGLVLPDFDAEGHLRGKFEAGTAHRIDQEHVGFEQLKITTFTPEDQPDLRIDMSTSVLDLKTRILSSKTRSTIQRADFNIAGDSVEFDTNSKTGRLIGNVKMVITDTSRLTAKPDTNK
jgi:lipopolysaccharide assembly outer membrane protein LptD (OstA)